VSVDGEEREGHDEQRHRSEGDPQWSRTRAKPYGDTRAARRSRF
jgi:hypothetical protein